jgi:hypothetical protein
MLRSRILRLAVTVITAAGTIGGFAALATGTSLAATTEPTRTVAVTQVLSSSYECFFPIISPFYCNAQTQKGNAPLFDSAGNLYTKLPLNDQVKVTCWYFGTPPSPWKSDGIMDHVTTENISNPIVGHIPDHYVNFGGQVPSDLGMPQC